MNAQPLEPDAPSSFTLRESPAVTPLQQQRFEDVLNGAGAALERADEAERAFAEHRGGLVEMMVERANADVILQIATSAAQRTTQAVSTLFGMQV